MGEFSVNGTNPPNVGEPNGTSGVRLANGRLKDEYHAPIPPDTFTPRPGDQILDIGIIGAGIAGLAAAAALVQSGHNVDVGQCRCQEHGTKSANVGRFMKDRGLPTKSVPRSMCVQMHAECYPSSSSILNVRSLHQWKR